MPPETVGGVEVLKVLQTPDGKSYAYTYTQDISALYVVSGLS